MLSGSCTSRLVVIATQLALRLDRRGNRVCGNGECGAEAVSARGEHVAVVALVAARTTAGL